MTQANKNPKTQISRYVISKLKNSTLISIRGPGGLWSCNYIRCDQDIDTLQLSLKYMIWL